MTMVYAIWCEWDIGQEGRLFSSKEKALQWLDGDSNLKEVMEECGYGNVQELMSSGLVSITEASLD